MPGEHAPASSDNCGNRRVSSHAPAFASAALLARDLHLDPLWQTILDDVQRRVSNMRYFMMIVGGMTVGLCGTALGQMGGMANPGVAGGNMNAGAVVANMGGNANFGSGQTGVGGGYAGTTAASGVGSNLAGSGGYPMAARDARFFGQNSGTVNGMYGTGAAMANQPGQPFALNRYRSMFTSRGVSTYNPRGQARFGGPNNGQRYGGQGFVEGNPRAYSTPNYSVTRGAFTGRGSAYRFSNVNSPGSVGFNGPLNNGLPVYTSGMYSPGVSTGYMPYSPYRNGVPFSYPTTNGLAPGSY